MKIVVDIYGGDNAPDEILKGCVLALNSNRDISLVMVGKQAEMEEKLSSENYDKERVEFVDAQDVITCDEAPTTAIRLKKESSLVKALDITKADDDVIGMVSAGSTGAVLTGALLKIGRIRGISRPALAPALPTLEGGNVLIIDCGANVDCRPEMIYQFALMGSAYMKAVYNIEDPRVGLLSNGTEDAKGNQLTKEAFSLLKDSSLNFVGNMEARDITSGNYDVIACDGFMGNIALKASEGVANMMLKMIKREVYGSFKGKLGGALLKGSFNKIRSTLDYNQHGGAPFIGVEKLVIKSHGSSKAQSICGSIMQVVNMHKNDLIGKIKAELDASMGPQA